MVKPRTNYNNCRFLELLYRCSAGGLTILLFEYSLQDLLPDDVN